MKEQLCHPCMRKGLKDCWFKITTQEIIKALPSSDNQTPIAEDTTITKEAFRAHENIARDRILARSYGCPQVNYNPQNSKLQPNL